jgi:predicted transposase YdaD
LTAGERPGYDQPLKALLGRAHDAFLALVAPDLTWLGELSPVLPAIVRQADLVWEVVGRNGERGLLHLELQTIVETDLGERMAEYGLRLWRHHHLPVRSVVVLLRATARPLPSPFRIVWGDREILRYGFDVVRLWEQPQEAVLDAGEPRLWPLAPLLAGATVATTAAVAERLAGVALPLAERRELLGLLGVLAGLQLPSEVVVQALRRNPMIRDIIRESSFAQLLLEEGRQEGRQEGQRETVRLLLESRFGPLEPSVLSALEAADEPVLQGLVAHLATDTWSEISARLGLR